MTTASRKKRPRLLLPGSLFARVCFDALRGFGCGLAEKSLDSLSCLLRGDAGCGFTVYKRACSSADEDVAIALVRLHNDPPYLGAVTFRFSQLQDKVLKTAVQAAIFRKSLDLQLK